VGYRGVFRGNRCGRWKNRGKNRGKKWYRGKNLRVTVADRLRESKREHSVPPPFLLCRCPAVAAVRLEVGWRGEGSDQDLRIRRCAVAVAKLLSHARDQSALNVERKPTLDKSLQNNEWSGLRSWVWNHIKTIEQASRRLELSPLPFAVNVKQELYGSTFSFRMLEIHAQEVESWDKTTKETR
jgi:hypothetical protein